MPVLSIGRSRIYFPACKTIIDNKVCIKAQKSLIETKNNKLESLSTNLKCFEHLVAKIKDFKLTFFVAAKKA